MSALQEFAPGVARLPILFVNVYFVDTTEGDWVLIDTGVPGFASKIKAAAEERYGSTPPKAIVLTHGHFDHAGNARELAEMWDVPIYAHRLELPYLKGKSDYPPKDPTIGGAIAFMSRFMPAKSLNLEPHLHSFSTDDEIHHPALEGWDIIFTPGHSPGHISLWNGEQSTLIAGDAFATEDMDSWVGMATMKQTLARAGASFNCDWDATRDSVQKLAKLRPKAVGCGHGVPVSAEDNSLLADDLEIFASEFPIPGHGRYVPEAAQTNEAGVQSVPPPAPDPLPKKIAIAALLFFAFKLMKRQRAR